MSGLRVVTITFPRKKSPKLTTSVSVTKSISFSEVKDENISSRLLFGEPGTVEFAETLFEMLEKNKLVHDPTWTEGRSHHIMTFRARGKEVRRILENLMVTGIGGSFGRIDIAEITASIPGLKRSPSTATDGRKRLKYCPCLGKRSFALTDRMTLQEIHGIIDGQVHLTCEYITLVFVAAVIASIGLRRNSATTVISSMLVSPLMGPILGMTFGLAIRDKKMIWKSFRNEAIGIFICIFVGAVIAFIDSYILKSNLQDIGLEEPPAGTPRNLEMYGRTQADDLYWGFFVAVPSGVGVALAISSGGINALVGVAISAALLPPICNAGMLLVYTITFETAGHLGLFSLGLFGMNLVCILLVGYLTFRIKGIVPPKRTLLDMWRESSSLEASLGYLPSDDERVVSHSSSMSITMSLDKDRKSSVNPALALRIQ